MREILFRGKREEDGEWAYGSFVPDAIEVRGSKIIMPGFIRNYDFGHESGCKVLMHEVDRETVGQFTGLTDKNGKKIFEGDIIELERGWGEKVRYIVKYDTEICSFIGDGINYIGFTTFENDGERIEVIGNIHDNPELLKGE